MSAPLPEVVAAFVAAVDEFHDETNRPSLTVIDAVGVRKYPDRPERTPELRATVFRTGGELLGVLVELGRTDHATRIQRLLNSLDTVGMLHLTHLRETWEGLKAELQVLALATPTKAARRMRPPPSTPAGESSPSLRLFLEHACPHPPEPPPARIEAAALVVAETLSTGRRTAEGERVFRLSGLAALSRRPDSAPGVGTNGYRWAVQRLIEAGLVTAVMADPPPVVRLSQIMERRNSGQPIRDASGQYLPGISKQPPPVPHLRSTPELWVRWRAGCMFPSPHTTGGKKVGGTKPVNAVLTNLDRLQRKVIELHQPKTSHEKTAERARQCEEVNRLAKELGKSIDAKFVHSCLVAQKSKAKKRRKKA